MNSQPTEIEPTSGPSTTQPKEPSVNNKKRKKNKKRKNGPQATTELPESERNVLAGSNPAEDTTRVLADNPRLVLADVRLGPLVSPAFLYLPPGKCDMVVVGRIDQLRTFEAWEQDPPPLDPSYRISESPGKGLGMFATRAIRQGELLLDERPIYVTSQSLQMSPDQVDDSVGTFYRNAMSGLSSESREALLALSNGYPPTVHDLLGKLRTNYLQVDVTPVPDANSGFLAVFPTISRANHSCSPSANYYFLFETFSGQVYAMRDIAEGEEITISYGDLLADRQQRQTETRKQWNFVCSCETCSLPVAQRAQSDKRRRQLAKVMARMQMPWGMSSSKESVEEAVGWAEAEGLMVHKAQMLLFGSAAARGRPGQGTQDMTSMLQKAREAFIVVEGEKSHSVRQIDRLLLLGQFSRFGI